MFVRQLALLALVAASASAFVTQAPKPTFKARNALLKDYEATLDSDIKREVRHDGWAFFLENVSVWQRNGGTQISR